MDGTHEIEAHLSSLSGHSELRILRQEAKLLESLKTKLETQLSRLKVEEMALLARVYQNQADSQALQRQEKENEVDEMTLLARVYQSEANSQAQKHQGATEKGKETMEHRHSAATNQNRGSDANNLSHFEDLDLDI